MSTFCVPDLSIQWKTKKLLFSIPSCLPVPLYCICIEVYCYIIHLGAFFLPHQVKEGMHDTYGEGSKSEELQLPPATL